jgi:hypothetical protein
VALAVRGNDKILIHLDWLLERYHVHAAAGDQSLRRIILCDIFSTAFMTKHRFGEPGIKNVFHSAYTNGGMVSAAGTMEVKAGVITGMRPDSGHYKPTDQNFVGALQALQMFGVRMERLHLFDFKGDLLGTALEFMSSRLSWAQFEASRQDVRYKRALAATLPPSLVTDASGESGASLGHGTYNQSPQAI